MKTKFIIVITLLIILLLSSCNLPQGGQAPNTQDTDVATTLSAMQTGTAAVQVLPPQQTEAVNTSTPVPTGTSLPSATPAPQNPLVLKDTLCWVGPGAVYDVVSALKKDTRVELLGRGSISGWWIVKNPIYKDPCWVQEGDLQIDPGYNTVNLKIFNPPPTPTPTYTPTYTSTP